MNKSNWIDIIIIAVLVSCVLVSVQYYLNMKNDSCIANPLVYGAKQYEDNYGVETIGTLSFKVEKGNYPTIYFNSVNVTTLSY